MKLSFEFSDYSISENSKKHYSKAKQILKNLQQGLPADQPIDWFAFPNKHASNLLQQFTDIKKKLTRPYDLVITIGIGGSYLGCRTVYNLLRGSYDDLINSELSLTRPRQMPIAFSGINMASSAQQDILQLLKNFDPLVVVISKTGGTLEPALSFRFLRQALQEKYGQSEAMRRIVTITDPEHGTLRQMSAQHAWPSAEVPANIGGRYSVLTAAGLLPLFLAGYDLKPLLDGSQDMFTSFSDEDAVDTHPAIQFAAYRSAAYEAGKKVEVISTFEPKLSSFLEWYQQLYGESLGKENRGLFIAPLRYSTDLHSMGQYMQEGERLLTQTTFLFDKVQSSNKSLMVPNEDYEYGDHLGYLVGEELDKLNNNACLATLAAHKEGGVGSVLIRCPELSLYTLGQLFAFFQTSCAVEGLLQGLNPFDQPGVEAYKQNMLALFGKPGLEELGRNLRRHTHLT